MTGIRGQRPLFVDEKALADSGGTGYSFKRCSLGKADFCFVQDPPQSLGRRSSGLCRRIGRRFRRGGPSLADELTGGNKQPQGHRP